MSSLDTTYPQFIRVDRDIKKKYLDKIKDADAFAHVEATDIFFICAALGVKNSLKKDSGPKPVDLRLYSTLQSKYKTLIRLISLKDQDYDYEVLKDGKKMLKIVESYANGGAVMLHDKIFKGDGLDFFIEDEVWDEVKKGLKIS